MVLESLISVNNAESKPRKMILLGFLYSSIAIFLSLWIFKAYSSLIMVFLTSMASIPLIYYIVKYEEEKDIGDLSEKLLIKEHSKAVSAFFLLFLGATLSFVFWYAVLPAQTISVLFESQTTTISTINPTGHITGFGSQQITIFSHIFLNNLKVLVFCILFSFLYGVGAIFILIWNASVIGTAIGNFIRTKLALVSGLAGLSRASSYLQIISLGLFKYSIHGIPEILSYFTAGLAGGIISVAVIKHDFSTRKFEHILLDSADLLLLSIFLLFVAALLEVYVTPVVF